MTLGEGTSGGDMTDPEHLLRQYEGKLAEARRKGEAIRETMAGLRVTERSDDGQITVTVNDAGNLVDLHLGEALRRKDGPAVAREVLRVVQAAQSRVATTVQEAMTPLLGGDSQAMGFMVDRLRSAQPPPRPPAGGYGAELRFGPVEDDAPPPPPPPPPAPLPPRQPRPRHQRPDDDDFSQGGFLR